jgi:hypothetical protein
MSDDLIKRLRFNEWLDPILPEAAYRIEELERGMDALQDRLDTANKARADANFRANENQFKLAKAVEYLRKIAAYTHIGTHEQGIVQNAEARIACTALAELGGES